MAIATLIAAGRLDDRMVGDALERLRPLDPTARLDRWIDRGDAADLWVDADPRAVDRKLRQIEGADIVVQPDDAPRPKRLLVADMDSTIIGQECIDELADFAGLKPEVAAITERAMRGELDFPAALRERVKLLAGMDEAVLGRCRAERVRPNPGAETLVRTMHARGATCLLVSGGFMSFAEPVGEMVGFERVCANRLAIAGGKLTGEVEGPIVDAVAKRDALIAARSELGLQPADVLAVGDGANDLLMIEEAGLGVAYRAKPVLAEAADARLDHHGLDALLWAQGIRRLDWVCGNAHVRSS